MRIHSFMDQLGVVKNSAIKKKKKNPIIAEFGIEYIVKKALDLDL